MRAVHALGTSLDAMLDVSRLDAGVIVPELQAAPLNPLFQSVNQMFASRADEKGLQLRLRASPLWVRSDPKLLQRLLVNLVENAIKYTVHGGVLPRRVLLIDDEADIGDAMTALLGSCGVALQVVRDETLASAAFTQAAAQAAPFDALVCDYRLADGADGLDVALRLRTRFDPQLPLLLVTGETAPARLQRVRDSGVPVLFKPVAAEVLLAALAALRRAT